MKKILILAVTIALISSCKKSACYVCDESLLGDGNNEYCKNDTVNGHDIVYMMIEHGGVLTDPSGNHTIHCTRK